MSVGMSLADVWVNIGANLAPFERSLARVQSQLASGVGMALGIGAGALGIAGLVRGVKEAIMASSNLVETQNKVNEVFGAAKGPVEDLASLLVQRFGQSRREILDAASSIGLIGIASGQSQAQAATLAANMAKLAVDAASFYNVPLDDALERIRAGLVGQSRPMRAFGVLLDASNVKAKALAMGFRLVNGQLDNQAKLAARTALITTGLAKATGDLERTQFTTANQLRQLQGRFENLLVTIGDRLSPAFNKLISLLNEMFTGGAGAEARAMFEPFYEFGAWLESSFIGTLETIGYAYRNWGDLAALAGTYIEEAIVTVGARFEWLAEVAGTVAGYMATNWQTLLTDAILAVDAALANLAENFSTFAGALAGWIAGGMRGPFAFEMTPLLKGFAAAAPGLVLPEFGGGADLSGARAEILGRLGQREAEWNEMMARQGAGPRGLVKDVEEGTSAALKGGKVMSSSEFGKELLSNVLKDIPKQQLDEAKEANKHLQKIENKLGLKAEARFA